MKVENEQGVVVAFAQACRGKGWEIESVQAQYPDAVVRHVESDVSYRAEFE